jgi:N-acetylmuramoyl-L-alanine amidase
VSVNRSLSPLSFGLSGHYLNNCTVGIELCHPGADGHFTSDTLSAAEELYTLLFTQFSIDPLRDIWTHYAITGKNCPRWFIEHLGDFEEFKAQIFLRR